MPVISARFAIVTPEKSARKNVELYHEVRWRPEQEGMERIDVAVVGGGVTGLASARAIAGAGLSTCVLERHARPGLDTSTHNSGVIHAGLYYPPGSLKARLCVEGRHLLYEFCSAHNVPHRRCGKLVVAGDAHEVAALEALRDRARANGVEGVEIVGPSFVAAREPHVHAVAALFSPESGVVDAEELVKALLRSGEAADVIFLQRAELLTAEPHPEGIVLHTGQEEILAQQVVNAAGLYADDVSRSLGGESFTIHPCRGEYVELTPARRALVNALVYPLPHGHGLGVHLVRTLGGAVWLGPTVRYQARKDDYEDDRLAVEDFVEPARRLLRTVSMDDLRLSGSGIRAKLQGPDDPFVDFLIRRDRVNPAVVQAAGIDSPGLTSCLAVGNLVKEIVVSGARRS
jgi:L-2-hydroxyglutarate oxidase LhgO